MPHALRFHLLSLVSTVCLGGCQKTVAEMPAPVSNVVEMPPEHPWQGIASGDDQRNLDRLSDAWAEALASARRAGFARVIAAEGPLLDPDAAQPQPAPPPGSYMCRVIKLGATGRRAAAFTAFKPFFCHVGVRDDQLSITKQTGSQRPAGYLWEDGRRDRLIFLGSMALGDEDVPLPYGENRTRDMAGVFERVSPFRYRLVIPYPNGASKLDVFELKPAPIQAEEG